MRLFFGYFCCRSLYGFVDWNPKHFRYLQKITSRSLYGFVDWNPFPADFVPKQGSRSLYGFVDWNRLNLFYSTNAIWSKPIRLRGLKYLEQVLDTSTTLVEAYTASWIEIVYHTVNQRRNSVEAYTASWIEMSKNLLWIYP